MKRGNMENTQKEEIVTVRLNIPNYLNNIILKIDNAIETAKAEESINLHGLILARQIINQETRL